MREGRRTMVAGQTIDCACEETPVTGSDAASVRPVRLAMVGMAHETNTYSDVPADLGAFEADGILRGDEIVAMHATASTTVAGFLEAGTAPGVQVVPLLYTSTGPCGTITAHAFETIVGEMVSLIRDRGPWDGVLLAQHGAAGSAEFPDADGEGAEIGRAHVLTPVTATSRMPSSA